ncbi:MAG: radical SAM protein [Desulfobacteraceae bacterium]
MPDLVLVQPPVEDFYLTAKRTIPYGLACIAGSLRERGFSVEILDCLAVNKSKPIPLPEAMAPLLNHYGKKDLSSFSLFHQFRHYGYSFEHAGTVIRDKKPRMVGISSLFTPYCQEALRTAEAVKRFHPECTIVIGGHHPTHYPEQVLAWSPVDFVIRGEGEEAMPMLAEALLAGTGVAEERLEKIPGLVFRKRNGSIHTSTPAWIDPGKTSVLPAMDLICTDFYRRKKRAGTVVVTSRGCPMNCSYCCFGDSSFPSSRFRQRRIRDVVRELKTQTAHHDIGFIDFEDENLTLNKRWFLWLLAEIESLFPGEKPELRAMNGLYPPSLDREIIQNMKRAGFTTLNLSLGSTSKEQLNRFNRPDVTRAFEEALLLAEEYGLETVAYIIAGAPGQSAEESVQDLLFLGKKRTLAGLSIFYPAPGSGDYALCRKNGLLPDTFSMMRSTALPVSDTTTRLESATLLRLARILNFMKFLVDNGQTIPPPKPCPPCCKVNRKEKRETGKKLLSWFLHDGTIRGVTENNQVFPHTSDGNLTRLFLAGINRIEVKGVTMSENSNFDL